MTLSKVPWQVSDLNIRASWPQTDSGSIRHEEVKPMNQEFIWYHLKFYNEKVFYKNIVIYIFEGRGVVFVDLGGA